jgi:hypothetical protein
VAKPCLWQVPFAEGIPSEGTSSACPEECITRSVILIINERGALSMANGGFKFLLLAFQFLVSLVLINLVFSMNLFRFRQLETYQHRSLIASR